MKQNKNILFIMCDQLRWDYLSCAGHKHLHTPNIDWLANNGVRFDRAYAQAPVCGPSRACTYTGRYQSTLGVRHNGFPLRIDELGLGHYLQSAEMRTAVIGKTDLHTDPIAAQRLGVDLNSAEHERTKQMGFEPYDRDSGIRQVADATQRIEETQYDAYLREQGYEAANPWLTYANSSVDEAGNLHNGWFNQSAQYPANIPEEHSETAYVTNRAIEFIKEQEVGAPWCLHLGYIKPHWPYIAPAPYHAMYGAEQVQPANRTQQERDEPHHPAYAGFLKYCGGRGYETEAIRQTVARAYMGLVKQVDDHIGRLLNWMRSEGVLENTLIVFTSDHGDYLGDHWLVDKYWFHEESVRVPLIIYDPAESADATRGTVCDEMVELIDILPTLIEYSGATPNHERLEGHSLMPFLRGEAPADWREFAISEEDYSSLTVRHYLGLQVNEARATMLRTKRWKYILHEVYRAELYDMENDPQEHNDLGESAEHATIRQELHEKLFRWFRRRKLRFTRTNEYVMMRSQPGWVESLGVHIGYWGDEQGVNSGQAD